jgi:hypothetical protein
MKDPGGIRAHLTICVLCDGLIDEGDVRGPGLWDYPSALAV